MSKYNKAFVAAIGAALTAVAPAVATAVSDWVVGVLGVLATTIGTWAVRNADS